MTLTELRYIVALFDSGHFRKAAEACHVSQPTLSIAIKKLEEELGVTLFERSRHQVSATAVGEQIVAQARSVLHESMLIQQLAESGRDPLGSILSVGAIFTIGPYLFPRLVSNLTRLAPDMPLYIEESYTAVLRRKLRDGTLDAIVVALPFNEPDVVCKPLFEEPFVVLMHTDHPLASQQQVQSAEIKDHNVLLMGEGHCFRDQVLEACCGLQESLKLRAGQLQSVVDGSSLETLKHMVASGLGITVLPESAANLAHYPAANLTCRPFAAPAPVRSVGLAWRATFPRHQAIDILSAAILTE